MQDRRWKLSHLRRLLNFVDSTGMGNEILPRRAISDNYRAYNYNYRAYNYNYRSYNFVVVPFEVL
jgi:hypothetical protein